MLETLILGIIAVAANRQMNRTDTWAWIPSNRIGKRLTAAERAAAWTLTQEVWP